ncbi:thiamine pyrophosphate-binding protein [Lachnospiraceae bacterium MD1]|uniref:Thiamine pyrophosphate-binding protein n=1 Tax=Variimorphobacter saccharofermentans TaxID=2755051 RepID=A0A839JZM0_9FIRM|nr:thiamine pyrophosphate-binding protein [Variimorphobacter saccharofermentans]MBB2182850.1 thiamine pyrophosphate-binding protein [Variimorphobacter saccharofermentans]
MRASEFIVKKLIEDYGVSDAFGIPGGVILKLLYAMNERQTELEAHLMTNEQTAGFAACGYAQASGQLGVAYATRGPGITNMMTSIAEAYQESLPVLFITAHGNRTSEEVRFSVNQELVIVDCVKNITKYAVEINRIEDLAVEFIKACETALEGRKGPVLIDILASLFDKTIQNEYMRTMKLPSNMECSEIVEKIEYCINEVSRPVLLIGDGIRYCVSRDKLDEFINKLGIPVLSSRGAQDLICNSKYYYGYIGSHGVRYSNFILSKSDLILVIGNRLAFPFDSVSFLPIISNAKIIRIDIDEKEFNREISGADNYNLDAKCVIEGIVKSKCSIFSKHEWLKVCDEIKNSLETYDRPFPVVRLESYLKKQSTEKIYISDVGNNEFFLSRAFESVHPKGNLLCSKSYGTLGVALGRAIGAYYATRKEVICIVGDQGFQYNTQDLHYISMWNLPIKVIIMNNNCSGMIADHERKLFGNKYIHTDIKSGYTVPDLKKIAEAYNIPYTKDENIACDNKYKSIIYEIEYENVKLEPDLPKGNNCQDMYPLLEREKYRILDEL